MTTAQDPRIRDVLRFAYAQGPGKGQVTAPVRIDPDAPHTSGLLPPGADPNSTVPLPRGAHELLTELPFPDGRFTDGEGAGDGDQLGWALSSAFGLVRQEPSNPYNDHRAHPSVRSKFPVHAFVTSPGGRHHYLDPYRCGLVGLPDGDPTDRAHRVVLAGRFTHLPSYYRLLRGPLTELELGINLRTLAMTLQLFGLQAGSALRLPGLDGERVLTSLGLAPAHEWSLPIVVELPRSQPTPDSGPVRPQDDTLVGVDDSDLGEVVRVNRHQRGDSAPEPLTAAIPGHARRGVDWSQVLWRRTAGRMPRALSGMNGRRRRVPAAAFLDAAAWGALPPPGPTLRAAARHVRVTAVVQDVTGHADGTYRIGPAGPEPVPSGQADAARLEAVYGYPLTTGNGCDVRHATAVWFLSADLRALVAEFGPRGWHLAQYVCGWIVQGLCVAAAAHDLYARPTRAFDELPTQRLLGLPDEETLLFSVVSGTGRFTEPLLDLRL
ncbi:hypothetical protein ACFVY4_24820 [Streptomyces sp. NPDC058299]|uniref:hypothetical protein n=1 Tax=Streptomyces sp. NPDC058299 TaxID=3346435 RepID=UPI0036EB2251